MSEIIPKAVTALQAKLPSFDGVAKFVFADAGSIMMDPQGVRAGDEAADVTLTASTDVFRAILEGEMHPTKAYMTGKLGIEGDMGMALKLAAALA